MMDEIQQKSGFGNRLKNAREALRLSEKEVAVRLHLTPSVIQILESESFENGPPATFMRGYLKSYARLLNFSDQEVNIALDQLGLNAQTTSAPIAPMLNASSNLYKSERYVNWITYLIVLVLLVMVGTWWNSHPHTTLQNAFNLGSDVQQSTAHSVTVNPLPTSQPAAIPETAAAATAPAATAPTSSAPVATTSPTGNNTIAAAPTAAPSTPAVAPSQPAPPAPVAITNTPPGTSSVLQPDTALPANTVANNNATDDAINHKKTHSEDSGTGIMLPEPGLE